MLKAKLLYSYYRNAYQRLLVLKALSSLLGVCCYLYLAVTFGELVHTAFLGMALAVCFVIVAYSYPTLTVVLWAVLTVYTEQLLSSTAVYIGGGVDAHYSDPVMFAMAGALLVRLALGDERLHTTLFRYILSWTLLVGWVLFQVVCSTTQYGIVSPLGEFRTYFQDILVIPYIITFFRNRDQQWRLFLVLFGLSFFGLLTVAFYRVVELNRFTHHLKAAGNLAILYGTVSLYIMYHYGRWKHGSVAYLVLLLVAISVTFVGNHRSVWLASGVLIVFLVLLGYLPLSRTLWFAVIALLGVLIVDGLYTGTDVIAQLEERLLAFTSFQDDHTAKWRYYVWVDALQQSREHLLEGKGLGNYFMTVDHRGLVVAVMLHNQYVQLIYQVGLVGLVLYLAFVAQCLRHFWRTYTRGANRDARLMVLVASGVLLAGSAYYFAYAFDIFTWLFVGLGLAVSQSCLEQDQANSVLPHSSEREGL